MDPDDSKSTYPVFCSDRELVSDVLREAMDRWISEAKPGEWNDPTNFYIYANNLGKARTNSLLFIGSESIPYSTPEKDIENAAYVFFIDYINGKIVAEK